jgi:dedicator of cytokinesis protein 3
VDVGCSDVCVTFLYCSFPSRRSTSIPTDTHQVALAHGAPTPDSGLSLKTPLVQTPNPNHSPLPPSSSPDLRENPSAQPSTSSSGAKFHHIFLDVRTVFANIAAPGELVELYFSLFNKSESRYVTEEFCLVLNHNGAPARESEGRFGQMRTLFRDLSQHDVADQLYLVCRIVKNGAVKGGMTSSSSTTSPPMGSRGGFLAAQSTRSDTASFDSSMMRSSSGGADANGSAGMLWTDAQGRESLRRPFGCAVLELSQFNKRSHEEDDGRLPQDALDGLEEHQMSIFVPVAESAFSTLHEDIIHSRVKELEKSPRAEHLAVSVRILHGEVDQLVRDLPIQLEGIPFTSRLGFPDVVFPGDQRNEVYLKLWSGEFSGIGGGGAGGTGTVRSLAQLAAAGGAGNVEVTAELRTREGSVVERVLSRGAGEPNVTTYTSMVYRSNNSPSPSSHLFLFLH